MKRDLESKNTKNTYKKDTITQGALKATRKYNYNM